MPTTANGTAYTVYTSGTMVYGVADATKAAPGVPTLLYAHGNGGAYDQFATLSAWTGLRNWIIDNGWAWVESACGGPTSWGNQAARDDQRAAVEWAMTQYDMGDIIVLGRSMGGLVSYWSYLYDPVIAPKAKGLIVNSGTTDLAYRVTYNEPNGDPAILAAYGAANLSEFPAKSAGHDPMLFPVGDWAGKRVLQLYGTADTDVPSQQHALAWVSKYGSTATTTAEAREGGDHSSGNGSYHQVSAMTRFLLNAPEPVGPSYLFHNIARYYLDDTLTKLRIPAVSRR